MSKIPKKEDLEQYRIEVFKKPENLKSLNDIELVYLKSYTQEQINIAADLYISKVYYPALNRFINSEEFSSPFTPVMGDNLSQVKFSPVTYEEVNKGIPNADTIQGADYVRAKFIERSSYCDANALVIKMIEHEQQLRFTPISVANEAQEIDSKDVLLTHEEIALIQYYLSMADEGECITKENMQVIANSYGHINSGSGRSIYNKYINYCNDEGLRCGRSGTSADGHRHKRLQIVINHLAGHPNSKKRAENEFNTLVERIKGGKSKKL